MAAVASSLPGAGLTSEFLTHPGSQEITGWSDTLLPRICQPHPLWMLQHCPRTLDGKGMMTPSQEAGVGGGGGGASGFPESPPFNSGWKGAQTGEAHRSKTGSAKESPGLQGPSHPSPTSHIPTTAPPASSLLAQQAGCGKEREYSFIKCLAQARHDAFTNTLSLLFTLKKCSRSQCFNR